MAERAVCFLVESLGSLLKQEASLLDGLRSRLHEIEQELQSMRSFLKDADRRKYSDDGVKTWVEQVREVANEVEDIMDKYMYHVASEDRGGGLMRRAVYKTILLPKHYYYKHQIAHNLQAIRSKIREISERGKRYGFQIEEGSTSKTNDDGQDWQRSGEYLRFISDDDIVGIQKNKDFLIKQLTEERPERVVVCVVGMGGLGKTTLVTKAYNSPQVKNYFECHAWITVSGTYKVEELIRSTIKELHKSNKEARPDAVNEMNTGDLVDMVISYLQNRRYVIVLDDVWESTVWEDIQVAFPNNRCGGRVIITTRKENVSSSFIEENVLHLEPLGNVLLWSSFLRKHFPTKAVLRS